MQTRVLSLEDGKDPTFRAQRHFPYQIPQILVFFVVVGIGLSVFSIYMTRYYGVQTIIKDIQPRFRPCTEEQNGLSKWLRPPTNIMHSMTDEELFWRATMVPQIKNYPFKRLPKIAFMFLTVGPLPLAQLWEMFLQGNEGLYTIYIHSLPTYQASFPSHSSFYRRQIPSKEVLWGTMSMCDAERRLLANALLDINNEWFVLLSESCIPLYNFSTVYTYLKTSRYSFLGAFDDPGPYGRGRYNPNMAPEVNESQWRKASQWFEIDRNLAVTIVKDAVYYRKFKEFCKPNCYVDEHYFPTMLAIEAPHLLANRTTTWVDWSRGGAHPATFGKGDITEAFLKRVLEGQSCLYNDHEYTICHLFARKFSPSALEPLLQLAPRFFGFG